MDLPGDDETAGLPEYASLVTSAIGGRDDVVLVAQSLGGFTAPLAAARSGVRALVFVNAMIPVPGETPGAWWGNTGWEQARIDAALTGGYSPVFDLDTYFLHDVPPEVAEAGLPYQRPEADVVFGSVLLTSANGPPFPAPGRGRASGDRFFPAGLPAEAGRRPARRHGGPAARAATSIALRYTTGVHARPATERHTASASRGQPAMAALASSATAAPALASTLAIAVSQAASPSRALIPCLVSRDSSTGTDHATASV